jgi:hypothetical protein
VRLAALAVVFGTALVLAGCGRPSEAERLADRRAEQARSLARQAGLARPVQDFLATFAAAPARRYQVTYLLPGEVPGFTVVSQDPPRRRIDVTENRPEGEVTNSTVVNDDGSFECTRSGGRWECARSEERPEDLSAIGSETLDRLLDALRASAVTYDFRVAGRQVAEVPATCLVTELKPGQRASPAMGQRGTQCVSAEGALLLVETPQTSLRATKYSTSVPKDAFELPARPS